MSPPDLTALARAALAAAALPPGVRSLTVAEAEAGDIGCRIVVYRRGRRPKQRRANPAAGREVCRADLVAALAEGGTPMPARQLHRLLRKAGKRHGAGTVTKALADLTRDGRVVNRGDGRGYHLREWVTDRQRQPGLFD